MSSGELMPPANLCPQSVIVANFDHKHPPYPWMDFHEIKTRLSSTYSNQNIYFDILNYLHFAVTTTRRQQVADTTRRQSKYF